MICINYNKVTISTDEDVIIHPIGDTHIGHINHNEKLLQSILKEIPMTPENRIVLMGDLIDCGIKTAIGASSYEQSMSPNQQLNQIIKIFKPFADEKMIDGCVMGNHEYRIMKESGIDVLEQFCNQLEIPYLLYSGVVTYSIRNGNERKKAYNLYMTHGKAGGGVENALRACKRLSNIVTADAYLMGHCHHIAATERVMQYVDSRNEKLTNAKQHFVLTGHTLIYDDSYAEQANLEISSVGFPRLILSGSNKQIRVMTD